MKSSPKQTKSVRSSKQGTSDNSKSVRKKTDTKTPNKTTTHPTKSVLREVDVQVREVDFLTEQEVSDIFTALSENLSRNIGQMDDQLDRIGSRDSELRGFLENYSGLKNSVAELVEMVKCYSVPFTERKLLLDNLEDKVKERQAIVDHSLKRLQKTTGELQLVRKQQVINNWEKVFCATEAYNTHGRRWKFRIQPLKESIKEGNFNFNADVVLQKAKDSENGDVDAILERYSRDTRSQLTHSDSEHEDSEEDIGTDGSNLRINSDQSIPPILNHDVTVWTHEPQYDRFLIIGIKQPLGFDKSLVMNVSVKDNCFTFEIPLQTASSETSCKHAMFHISEPDGELLQMGKDQKSESSTRLLSKEDVSSKIISLAISVHPESLQNDIIAMLHLPLHHLVSDSIPNTVVTETELSLEEINHDSIATQSLNHNVRRAREILDTNWREHSLRLLDSSSPATTNSVLLSHCWINVEIPFSKETGTNTTQLEEVIADLGYITLSSAQSERDEELRKLQESHEEEMDRIQFEAEEGAISIQEEQTEKLSFLESSNSGLQNEILQMASQLKTQQEKYESKIEELFDSLNNQISSSQPNMRSDALPQLADKSTSPLISASSLLEKPPVKKRVIVSYPKPNWEEMIQGNFLQRLEVFAEYVIKKQTHLRDKIRNQVSRAIEMQLATLHRLAPVKKFHSYFDISDEVSLPSIFLPTHCTKNLVYTPRARAYFHPFGVKSTRISQAPSIFKLTPKRSHSMRSVDLYALSDEHSSRIEEWQNQERKENENGNLVSFIPETPAPPPSTSMSFRASTASSIT